MPIPFSEADGFLVSLTGIAPREERKDLGDAALIDMIRRELVLVPVRVSDGRVLTPEISDDGAISVDGEADPIALQSAIDRAMTKYIDLVSKNLDQAFGEKA